MFPNTIRRNEDLRLEIKQEEDDEIEDSEAPECDEGVPEKIEELEKENEKYLDRLKHLQADFENYKRRATKEKKEIIALATERLVRELLTLLDDFERALANSKDWKNPADHRRGLEMLYSQLSDIISREGVEAIDTDCKIDPFMHEVMTRVESPDYDDNRIIECLRTGYKMGGKVIRPAQVVVCCRDDAAGKEGPDKDVVEEDDMEIKDDE